MIVEIPYAPRAAFRPYHERVERFSIGVAHRRAGKTVATVNDLIKRTIMNPRPDPRSAYIAPLYNQAKDVAWNYLKHYARPLLAKPPNESELYVELLNGGRIRLYGADNPDRLRGLYLDDVVLDEYADMHPGVWGEVIRPLLADRIGRATFIGTPKGRNAFYDLYERAQTDPDWHPFMLRASETLIVPREELEASRKDMTQEQYDQEFECSFEAAILGAYYGKEMAEAEREGRICDVPYNPALEVQTAWDLGRADATAIWFFQVEGTRIDVIDFYENTNQQLPHYAQVLMDRGYHYGEHWFPMDVKATYLGMDRTRVETLIDCGVNPRIVTQHKIMDGINAARVMFPRMRFDARLCQNGLEALRQYRADYDDKRRAFRDTPLHDWTSHAADAFRYLAMGYREIKTKTPPPPEPPRGVSVTTGITVNDMTWQQMLKAGQPKRTRI